MEKTIIYGIPNCDTIKKTLAWFKQNDLPFVFHNYKTEGITAAKLKAWSKIATWQILLNKKGTTWKKAAGALPDKELSQAEAIKLMQEHTSIIKRPVTEVSGTILVGFNEAQYSKQFLNK